MAPRLAAVVLALLLSGLRPAAAATPGQTLAAERLLGLLRGIGGEYGEAFDAQGGLVRPIELEEAGLLLAEARDLLPQAGLRAAEIEPLAKALGARAGQDVVDAQVQTLQARVTAATGVAARVRPPAAPSIERGRALFAENCASCHGERGAGDGSESKRLDLKPANFTDRAFMRAETPDDFFNVITLGRRRSGMPAWGDALSLQERWDLIRFVWTLHEDGAATAGQPGTVPDATPALSAQSDADLYAALATPPASEPERWLQVAALRARGFDVLADPTAPVEPPRTQAATPRQALGDVHRLLDEMLAARAQGGTAGASLATDAYMRFEPFEKRLGATEPGLVRRIEEGFVRLRQAARDPSATTRDIEALVAVLHRDVDEAVAALEPGTAAWVRFGQSATIILREGFEVVLIVGALIAYVRRGGTPRLVRSLYVGSAAGIAASVATAVVLATVLRLTPWAGEALEGAAMLLAAVVLFWVSYWLISKSEADRWQRYIRSKVQSAINTQSGTALAAAAFLAVYREGFETILFYQALFASAPAGDLMVPAGLVAGIVLLAVVYAGLERVGLRVPMGTFFLATGGFLYAMAIVFAGRGIAELQEAGLVPLTPVAWAPRVEVLGIFPTVESLVAQGVFVVLLAYAVVVTLRRRLQAQSLRQAEEPTAPRAAQS
ncbi:MAG TPA: FTR1 family protein [Candidatus Eisenbacteria bacterium]|nr:FTR1 family protein [Candidatus Eisenbacteria bacterium]